MNKLTWETAPLPKLSRSDAWTVWDNALDILKALKYARGLMENGDTNYICVAISRYTGTTKNVLDYITNEISTAMHNYCTVSLYLKEVHGISLLGDNLRKYRFRWLDQMIARHTAYIMAYYQPETVSEAAEVITLALEATKPHIATSDADERNSGHTGKYWDRSRNVYVCLAMDCFFKETLGSFNTRRSYAQQYLEWQVLDGYCFDMWFRQNNPTHANISSSKMQTQRLKWVDKMIADLKPYIK